jgi:hypothetical protein
MDDSAEFTLSILAGRPDTEFLGKTISHLVRACRFRFASRILVVDTLPPGRPQPPEILAEQNRRLLVECEKLRSSGVIDEIFELGSDPDFSREAARKHFGKPLREQRDYRGIPMLGWVYGMEKAKTDYFLHFDSDMLLHQSADYDWISEGRRLMEAAEEIMFVAPLPGPPTSDGALVQRTANYSVDPRGFYAFKTFSSRRFLVDRRRLQSILPITPAPIPWNVSWKRRLRDLVTGKGALSQWETMMSARLQASPFVRAHLRSAKAWTLHPTDHGERFLRALPDIIRRIELGEYPPAQAGKYDLVPDAWTQPTLTSP